ncbi:hypothetical protein KMZ93_02175 [Bradyrhizobium sediminis]|uniref:Uncharacterized protein n=1 Tax=Bradyrhizobium sediminis TaxID=2840469 RepID=A0A975RY88_9BRAD|nr:hypothetical protein [Bradyrhizobium sediminis]QWG23776.1 hypothetical protein KMZ93_02175 [Bradyrhizobium sediminis]
MALADRIQEFLQRLSPVTRGTLLTELERLEICGAEIPGAAPVLEKLRAEFRKDGSTQIRVSNPSRYFFAPLEPLLIDADPEHANSGRISRGSLAPIWEWISRDLLPTMARDYIKEINDLIASDNQRGARKAAATFQIKVVKSLENTISSPDAATQARAKLAAYTTARSAYNDLVKMLAVIRAQEALAKFNEGLPDRIAKLDDAQVAKIAILLDAFAKKNAEVLPFALTLVAKRLKTPWELIRLATKAAPSKNAPDIAATPYAITVSMVLDRLDNRRTTLRVALKNNRVLVAKEILTEIYDTEYALRVRIDRLDESEWGQRLDRLIDAIAALVALEISRFPEKIGHVLGSRSLRSHQSLSGRLTYLAWKGRDALAEGAAFCRKLVRAA